MIRNPDGMGAYRFAVLAGLRAVQLMRGCTPKVERDNHKLTVIAKMEIVEGKTEQLEVDDA